MNKINNPFVEILRVKNFLKIWGSQLLSQITVNLVNFILILAIFTLGLFSLKGENVIYRFYRS